MKEIPVFLEILSSYIGIATNSNILIYKPKLNQIIIPFQKEKKPEDININLISKSKHKIVDLIIEERVNKVKEVKKENLKEISNPNPRTNVKEERKENEKPKSNLRVVRTKKSNINVIDTQRIRDETTPKKDKVIIAQSVKEIPILINKIEEKKEEDPNFECKLCELFGNACHHDEYKLHSFIKQNKKRIVRFHNPNKNIDKYGNTSSLVSEEKDDMNLERGSSIQKIDNENLNHDDCISELNNLNSINQISKIASKNKIKTQKSHLNSKFIEQHN